MKTEGKSRMDNPDRSTTQVTDDVGRRQTKINTAQKTKLMSNTDRTETQGVNTSAPGM